MDPAPTPPVEPKPGPTSLVVDPDSACRTCGPFFGTLGSALTQVKPGDTIWVQGGQTYLLQDVLNVSRGGTFVAPVVVRSFGGEARFAPARGGIQNLLRVSQPYVYLRGLAFVGAEGDGVLINNSPGPVRLDSVRIDSCGIGGSGSALRAGPSGVHLGLSDLTMRHNANRPALVLESGVVIDDSLRVIEVPRP